MTLHYQQTTQHVGQMTQPKQATTKLQPICPHKK